MNSSQLSQVISSYICRREGSAFMSIRHVEDLRKLKPIITFIVDHFDELAKEISPLSSKASNTRNTRKIVSGSATAGAGVGSNAGIAKPASVNEQKPARTFLPSGAPPGSNLSVTLPSPLFGTLQEEKTAHDITNQSARHSRMRTAIGGSVPPLLIPTEDEEFPSKLPRFDDIDNSSNSRKHLSENSSSLSPRSTTAQQHQYSTSVEWKILKALVEYRVNSFINSGTVFDSLEVESSGHEANKEISEFVRM